MDSETGLALSKPSGMDHAHPCREGSSAAASAREKLLGAAAEDEIREAVRVNGGRFEGIVQQLSGDTDLDFFGLPLIGAGDDG